MIYKNSVILFLCVLFCCFVSCDKNSDDIIIIEDNVTFCDSVFFYETCLYRHIEGEDSYWRIPAILKLNNGDLLAVNDKRYGSEADLPGNIDIVYKKSTDNGRTWTDYRYLAQNPTKKGYGDPGIVETLSGKVICVFCGDNGSTESTPDNPINVYVAISKDHGETWCSPQKITNLLWGVNAERVECRKYISSFLTSGTGLCINKGNHAGRIMFTNVSFREKTAEDTGVYGNLAIDNFVVYSDDEGESWHVSERAFVSSNEAQLIELNNGDILLSARQKGKRGYNISKDGGVTWGRQSYWDDMVTVSCNGDIIRCYTDATGQNSVLLHSIPNSMTREDVSIFVSRDEGKTWETPVCIAKGPSAYSSLTILNDGTIGVFVEKKDENGKHELWYQNFSWAWLENQIQLQRIDN